MSRSFFCQQGRRKSSSLSRQAAAKKGCFSSMLLIASRTFSMHGKLLACPSPDLAAQGAPLEGRCVCTSVFYCFVVYPLRQFPIPAKFAFGCSTAPPPPRNHRILPGRTINGPATPTNSGRSTLGFRRPGRTGGAGCVYISSS